MPEFTAHVKGDQIGNGPVAASTRIKGVVDHLRVVSIEIYCVKLIIFALPHGKQDLCPIRRPGGVMRFLVWRAVKLTRVTAIPVHDPYLGNIITGAVGKGNKFVVR